MNRKEYARYRELLLLCEMQLMTEPFTINEIIEKIYRNDMKNYTERNSWRFYVHLNKFPAKMERAGTIKFTKKYRKNELGIKEKLWRLM